MESQDGLDWSDGGPRHRTQIAAFLDGETRQVWARDLFTGEPVFIEPGSAEVMRKRAHRREIGCTVAGCTAPISVRGGTKRDAYFHLTKVDHPGGAESFNHQQSKAMLAAWARQTSRAGTVVTEEFTIKDRARKVNRRPDVMVAVDDQQVALEVEYKDFAIADWQRKQDDLDRIGVATNWLFGHTKIRTHGRAESTAAYVRLPALASAMATGRTPVLVINPSTRQIGTIIGNQHSSRWLQPGAQYGYLFLDDIDACEFDPLRGMVTPTMARTAAAVADLEKEKARREAADLAEAQRLGDIVRRAKSDAESTPGADRDEGWSRFYQRCWDRWLQSPERIIVDRLWGERPPAWLTGSADAWGVHAIPLHWHTVLYDRVIAPHPNGNTTYEFWGLFRHLSAAGVPVSSDPKKRAAAMRTWLETIERAGLVRLDRDPVNRFITAVHVLHNWDTAPPAAHRLAALPLGPDGKRSTRPKRDVDSPVTALCPPEVAQELSARRLSVGRAMRAAGETVPLTIDQVRRWKAGKDPVPAWAIQFLPTWVQADVRRVTPSAPEQVSDGQPAKQYWCHTCARPLPEDRGGWDPHLGHRVAPQDSSTGLRPFAAPVDLVRDC